ncbi:N-acetylmuramoyl-L-alanine amidase [Acidiphilium iwatense]|uniref:N-acetylmuramoyl-L-alanine amidase n=1 Tax=Acidiphilium iwatense TaxID=768198 RepID=A0ABS9E0I9_9PROT|nr:N-acetylmuramoyl-L-alanine amidase [Acidiphilium iwatense]MCF3948511.1 N-acetylmuramoyl-L-alanine amidase [Acidiphilium iwatense]
MTSPNQDARPGNASIDHLVLHYTGMQSAEAAIARLCDPAAKVSAHYVVAEDGTIHALVPENRRAWHAGVSFWRGARALNDRSVGIEIVNPGHEFGYRRFPAAQMAAVASLCRAILARNPIPPRNVVAHSDIAPDRKQDPGELFPWSWLAEQGVGFWTGEVAAPGDLMADLAAIGYDMSLDPAVVVAAFQRRFRPARVDGIADAETAGRAAAIRELVEAACVFI